MNVDVQIISLENYQNYYNIYIKDAVHSVLRSAHNNGGPLNINII